jgi:8-oxo-dGTP diphosphatase
MKKRNLGHPKVGIGVIVLKGNKVLLHKRKNAHGEGTWSFPGGHLEFNENIEDCAKREVMEEGGISLKNIRLGPYTNDIFRKEGKHYITIYVIAEYKSGRITIREPERCERWEWFAWNDLPKPLFLPLRNLLKQKFNPFGK